MPDFFLTFGGGSPNRDRYKRIIADDYGQARALVFHHYGPRWAFLYDAEEFAPQPDRYGITELLPPLRSET